VARSEPKRTSTKLCTIKLNVASPVYLAQGSNWHPLSPKSVPNQITTATHTYHLFFCDEGEGGKCTIHHNALRVWNSRRLAPGQPSAWFYPYLADSRSRLAINKIRDYRGGLIRGFQEVVRSGIRSTLEVSSSLFRYCRFTRV